MINPKHLFWPEVCPFCGKVNREGVCSVCQKKIDQLSIEEPKCMKCGKPVRRQEQEYCLDCANTHHYYDRGMAVWIHKEPINQSIYRFKYHNQREYGKYYAREMARHSEIFIRQIQPEALIPVPLHRKRQRKRGYNQALILARELGKITNLPVVEKLLVRIKNTKPQKQQDHTGRRTNLQHAFAVKYRIRPVKSVLVIDDIYTTGNTIDGVSRVLKNAGVEKVYFLTISIGQGN